MVSRRPVRRPQTLRPLARRSQRSPHARRKILRLPLHLQPTLQLLPRPQRHPRPLLRQKKLQKKTPAGGERKKKRKSKGGGKKPKKGGPKKAPGGRGGRARDPGVNA